jgi:uncharacterized protein YndB with AHSA1/START domain
VELYVSDLHEVWDRLKDTVRMEVSPEHALLTREYLFPVPPSVFWDYLTKPEYRAIMLGASEIELRDRTQGRTSVDSVYYCYHGKMQSRHKIVDWQPFERFTINGTTPLGVNFDTTYLLEPTAEGTRLVTLWGMARGAWILCRLSNLLQKLVFARRTGEAVDRLREIIRQDLDEGTTFAAAEIDVEQIAACATRVLSGSD